MSILDTLFGGLFGDDSDSTEVEVEHPCSNCPSKCPIAPGACSVCQPYKEQMIDAIYRVEHKDEIIAQYEVVGTAAQGGSVVCPHCGGHSDNPYVCDYCGSKLQDGTGKIQVASAADIPNPVLEAQDIIFARYNAVKDFDGVNEAYGFTEALSGIGSEGLLSSLFSALTGANATADSQSIGNKMTEDEIEEMAKFYDVSVSDYLYGLDNGKYFTLSNKNTCAKAEETYSKSYTGTTSTSSDSSMLGGLAGLAGVMGLGSAIFGGSSYNRSAARNLYPGMGTTTRRPVASEPRRTASQPVPGMNHPGQGAGHNGQDPYHGQRPQTQDGRRSADSGRTGGIPIHPATSSAPKTVTVQQGTPAPQKATAPKPAPTPQKATTPKVTPAPQRSTQAPAGNASSHHAPTQKTPVQKTPTTAQAARSVSNAVSANKAAAQKKTADHLNQDIKRQAAKSQGTKKPNGPGGRRP